MKKVLLFTALAAALTAGLAQAGEKLVVAATPVPHAEILELIKPTLAKEGVDLEIKVFTDYVQPNVQVDQKRLDANYFQTLPYLDSFNKGKGTDLVTVIGVHVEPFGGYSKKVKSLSELKDGATIAIPNEGSNSGRALILLQKAGLIELKDPTNAVSTPKDIAKNPHNNRPARRSLMKPCRRYRHSSSSNWTVASTLAGPTTCPPMPMARRHWFLSST